MLIKIIISLVISSLASFVGFHNYYIGVLHRLFESGKEKIGRHKKCPKNDVHILTASNGLSTSVITKEGVQLIPDSPPPKRSPNSLNKKIFHIQDIFDFIKTGIEVIIDDEVTKRFSAAELPAWNLLTRTNKSYQYLSLRLTIIWGIGFCIRYFMLLPIRMCLIMFGIGFLVVTTAAIGYFPDGRCKMWIYRKISLLSFRILASSFSGLVTFHNRQNRARRGGICVANHTSPIDAVILSCDNSYALVGQSHIGFLGLLQRALIRATDHVWFQRFDIKDRETVVTSLRDHLQKPYSLPILIFPEGTCINNTSVMMFKKGCFEIGCTIYPAAIKYDPIFGDPFWNSSKYGYIHYLLRMMSSWAIVCNVWYLPPMRCKIGESAVEFANRVKSEIARQGGLVDLVWDGQLKRMDVKKIWKEQQQEMFSQRIQIE